MSYSGDILNICSSSSCCSGGGGGGVLQVVQHGICMYSRQSPENEGNVNEDVLLCTGWPMETNKQKKKKSLLTSGLGRVDTGGGARSVVHVVEVDVHGEGRGAVLRQTDRQTDTHTQREKKYIHISSQFASSKLCNLLWLSMSFFSLSFFSLSLSHHKRRC